MKKIKSIVVQGRKWFDTDNGNTYHSVNIIVDGKQVYKSDSTYGHGSMFEYTAAKWLVDNGFLISDRSNAPLHVLCDSADIALDSSCVYVDNEKDL